MKLGDTVRVLGIPPGLKDDNDLETKTVFELSVGREFPVVGFNEELVELEVGEVLGKEPYMESIWIEREYVQVVKE